MQRDQQVYEQLSCNLQELVKVTMERETHKYLLRKRSEEESMEMQKSEGRPRPASTSSKPQSAAACDMSFATFEQVKERCQHSDFYAMKAEYFED